MAGGQCTMSPHGSRDIEKDKCDELLVKII